MVTKRHNPFNKPRSFQANCSSVEEREAKILEMEARGFYVVRTYSYEREHNDYVATGYHGAKHRYNGSESRTIYGVLFRPVEVETQ